MSTVDNSGLTLQEVPELRRKTETVSRFLQGQLAGYLETLRPMFGPDRVFGKAAGGKTEVTGAERALAELQEAYLGFTHKPYDLPAPLDAQWLPLVGNAPELQPWEYSYPLPGKPIAMTSPVRWVFTLRSSCTPAQVKNALAGKESLRPDYLRQFVINALVLKIILARNPGLVQLFQDLRYEIKIETPAEFKGLPVVTIASCLTSVRPADDLIVAATAFSGVAAFIELIDLNAVRAPKDALKERLEELLK